MSDKLQFVVDSALSPLDITIRSQRQTKVYRTLPDTCFVTIHEMQSFDTDPPGNPEPSERSLTFPVCFATALPPGTCRRFALPNGEELAIYNVNGEYYATDNFCPHRGAALSDGAVTGHIVECSWHGWRFDVRTGECLTVTEKLRTYEVMVSEGMLLVEVS